MHLDIDLGGDIDDLCALAMLLRWPGVTLTGITVVGDTNGVRTGYTRYALELEGKANSAVPIKCVTSNGHRLSSNRILRRAADEKRKNRARF